MLTRRHMLQIAALSGVALSLPALSDSALATETVNTSNAFSLDILKNEAKTLAEADYKAPAPLKSEWLKSLNYDTYRNIRFNAEKSLWNKQRTAFRAQFLHAGGIFPSSIEIFEVVDGAARPVLYDPSMFMYERLTPPADLFEEKPGFSGFRVQYPLNRPQVLDEFLVFQGASYFRGVGKGQNYGLSARGLAIDTASGKGEEFPNFTKFWLEKPARGSKKIVLYALLDSPSVTGAYRFDVSVGESIDMKISCTLFARKTIEKLGIAPLTSMFCHGENDNRLAQDFRPEVHDNDGLLMHTGADEWLWRPLTNPKNLALSSFSDENPKGFGLFQRDRSFDNYQDLEAFYENRPSLWVEPEGNWGKGMVQLVEIPTDSEIHDNIVAYWVPEKTLEQGQSTTLDYRLIWGNRAEGKLPLWSVLHTHVGLQFKEQGMTKFSIDFQPSGTSVPPKLGQLQLDLSSNKGEILNPALMPNPHTGGWRVVFDLRSENNNIYELRCALRANGRSVSETWIYQWRS